MDAGALLILLIALLSFLVVNRRRDARGREGQPEKPKLPPGSMGWPYVGETLQLYSQDPNLFLAAKEKKYGKIFKTRILGCPCVMLSDPEAARFVLVTQAHLFNPTFPRSKEALIGPAALFFHHGSYHARLRRLVQTALAPTSLRPLLPALSAAALAALRSWAARPRRITSTLHELMKLSFEVGILAIFGHLEERHKDELKRNYSTVCEGYNSFPTNIPGTLYRKALLARKRLGEILSQIIRERRERKAAEKNLLGWLVESDGDYGAAALTDDQVADNLIGVLFAAQDTTASALTWLVKYLHDHPAVLNAVRAEQKAIQKLNEEEHSITWSQTRNMPTTHKVVLETLRMASIISFTFREAVADVHYEGYLIPKGWKVLPLFRNIHHSPEFFKRPENFDPSRFEVAPKPNTFMPFGNGAHACPGNELAKLEMLVFTHHLVTKFRWEVVGAQSGGIQYSPFPVPRQGLPARFWEDSSP